MSSVEAGHSKNVGAVGAGALLGDLENNGDVFGDSFKKYRSFTGPDSTKRLAIFLSIFVICREVVPLPQFLSCRALIDNFPNKLKMGTQITPLTKRVVRTIKPRLANAAGETLVG